MKNSLLPFVLIALASCTPSSDSITYAEELSRKGNYASAILAYHEHIALRLKITDRPSWENPYFYLLVIGDLELKQGKTEEAFATYELAEKNGVDVLLVSDRYRYIATRFEEDGKLREALSVLTKYRDRDPMLFDLMLDRIAKKLTALEDSMLPTAAKTNTEVPQ